jgi:hypothetical protein
MGWIWDNVGLPEDGYYFAAPALFATLASVVMIRGISSSTTAASFKRDGTTNKSSFHNFITGRMSLLSNKDSVLQREHVKDSIEGYEKLFSGARTNVGSLQEEASIKTREKE